MTALATTNTATETATPRTRVGRRTLGRLFASAFVAGGIALGTLTTAGVQPAAAHGSLTPSPTHAVSCNRDYPTGTRRVFVPFPTMAGERYARFWIHEGTTTMYIGAGWIGATGWYGSNGQLGNSLYDYAAGSWRTGTLVSYRGNNFQSAYGPNVSVYIEVQWLDGHVSTHFLGSSGC